jgi:hypothetical protein
MTFIKASDLSSLVILSTLRDLRILKDLKAFRLGPLLKPSLYECT